MVCLISKAKNGKAKYFRDGVQVMKPFLMSLLEICPGDATGFWGVTGCAQFRHKGLVSSGSCFSTNGVSQGWLGRSCVHMDCAGALEALSWGQLSQLLFTGRREISHPSANRGLQGGIKLPGVLSPVGMLIPAAGAAPLPCPAHPLRPVGPQPRDGNVSFLALPAQTGGEQPRSAPSRRSQEELKPALCWQGNAPVTAAQPPPACPYLVLPTAGS